MDAAAVAFAALSDVPIFATFCAAVASISGAAVTNDISHPPNPSCDTCHAP
ncbi:Uncharacterised protein [Mycobacterium tuberculosis]|uniref:Uncharacterized protein n=2 Tax=Mycobacterium tuberculosis TaxID=1773 RepID=Q8VJF4_MYCTO|nr:hypothetical protein MT2668 [Mycobacterium tuberculosis CDC1551]EFD74285.1 conserved hypothetical protein [Mycobacterium tuberculosis GM 1503]CFS59988.1 Uncharacterised protein [Mycobacterium tuberculosis]COW73732.1 Uncharacterised protein [Mycobacterium tuberculosis]COZ46290.1 Uncharacterised protein [Mycobacterium tuberculosis]